MTISLEQPAIQSMVAPYTVVDPYDEPHTVVAVRAIVTRDQLAAAVATGVNFHGGERGPDEWTVEEIRYFAETTVLTASALELQRDAEEMARMVEPDHRDAGEHAMALAVYRAVDRAYPKTV